MVDKRPSTEPWVLHVRKMIRTHREPVRNKVRRTEQGRRLSTGGAWREAAGSMAEAQAFWARP